MGHSFEPQTGIMKFPLTVFIYFLACAEEI